MKLALSALGAACLAACQGPSDPTEVAPEQDSLIKDRTLLFADEFDDGELDRDKWIVIGPDFTANDEVQSYVDSKETTTFTNAIEGADGGVLVLKAISQPDYADTVRQTSFLVGSKVRGSSTSPMAAQKHESR